MVKLMNIASFGTVVQGAASVKCSAVQQRSACSGTGDIHGPWAGFERYRKELEPQQLKGALEAAASGIY